MKREPIHVFLACVFGAFIGCLIALKLGGYFWPLGALVGGIVAYVAVDYRHFFAGIQRAWRQTRNMSPEKRVLVEYWFSRYVASLTAATYGFFALMAVAGPPRNTDDWVATPVILFILSGISLFFIAGPGFQDRMNLLRRSPKDHQEVYAAHLKSALAADRLFMRRWNPVSASLLLIWALGYAFLHLPAWTPPTLRFIGSLLIGSAKFCGRAFVYMHHDLRTICFIGGAIGTAFGYRGDSVIEGAILGGFVGLLEYLVVSVWWLRLNPRLSQTG